MAYYQEKGLISPASQENGYREFTQEEAGRLGTIAFLRRLGLPVQEIALLLASPGDAGATKLVQARQEDRLALQKKQLELLNRYLDGESPEALERQLEFLEQKQTIRQKLLGAFPGYYGRYISIHFGRFLQSPIETPEQRDAYEQILTFLDGVEFPPLTPGCQALLEQAETQAGDRELAAQPQRMEETMADFDAFWEENQNRCWNTSNGSKARNSNSLPWGSGWPSSGNLANPVGITTSFCHRCVGSAQPMKPTAAGWRKPIKNFWRSFPPTWPKPCWRNSRFLPPQNISAHWAAQNPRG